MGHACFIQGIVLSSSSPFAWGGDPVFDDMTAKMVAAINPGESEILAEKLDKYVYDNAMSIFTYRKITVYGFDKRLSLRQYVSGVPYFFSAEFSGRTE